jgi:hypothetical protein
MIQNSSKICTSYWHSQPTAKAQTPWASQHQQKEEIRICQNRSYKGKQYQGSSNFYDRKPTQSTRHYLTQKPQPQYQTEYQSRQATQSEITGTQIIKQQIPADQIMAQAKQAQGSVFTRNHRNRSGQYPASLVLISTSVLGLTTTSQENSIKPTDLNQQKN